VKFVIAGAEAPNVFLALDGTTKVVPFPTAVSICIQRKSDYKASWAGFSDDRSNVFPGKNAVRWNLTLTQPRQDRDRYQHSVVSTNAVQWMQFSLALSTFLHRFQNPAKLLHSGCVKRVTRERR